MKLNNKYYILRHGEAVSNVKNIVSSWPEKFKNPLTEKGREQIKKATKKLKNKKIDMIFASDLLRAKQTAEIVGKTLKIGPKFDKRLREIGFGALNARPTEELLYLSFEKDRLKRSFRKSETYESVLEKISSFLKDIEKKYKSNPPSHKATAGQGTPSHKASTVAKAMADKSEGRRNILIISHQCPLWILENKLAGFSLKEGLKRNPERKRIGRGELRKLN